jgi:hypothetical protein
MALIGTFEISRTAGMATVNPCSVTTCGYYFTAFNDYSRNLSQEGPSFSDTSGSEGGLL